ncbi:diguanylate cyclase [Methylobacterium sp. BTF04]|uniref:GGDEF domain-containing protein n=1 Tax=Methylobacterium sp. BTF04 TaxID=2708300 RepID=UPI0013D629AE|nr:diguanylate cyclase [Methylobacterium sp. BTF04]NEU13065.1 diguanylate cyclase [Methylobacterium sp. BTF04]
MGAFSTRSLTIAYVFALALVALMSLVSHLTLRQVLEQHEGAASVVNISGRQRMLSQRIASLSAQWAMGDADARRDLGETIDRFSAAHARLMTGDETLGLPEPSTPELKALYFGGADPLNEQVKSYIAKARAVRDMASDDPHIHAALAPLFAAAREPLLSGLDRVVSEHERTSRSRLKMLQWLQNASLVVVLLTLLAEAVGIFRPMVGRISNYTKKLITIATTDPLTGALNRRSFTERALAELARGRRYDRPTSMLMIDADRFKSVNDTYGHAGGDAVLQALTSSLGQTLRPSDVFGRLGGEEFGVILPETGLDDAAHVAERIRAELASLVVGSNGGSIRFTVSIGVSQFELGATELKPTLDRADAALYQAKAQGRDCVVRSLAPEVPTPISIMAVA